jgi:hypothetical protein
MRVRADPASETSHLQRRHRHLKSPNGDIPIELMACAAKFYIRDGELTFDDSGEFTVTHSEVIGPDSV